jgi:hypothetical membrane protein
METLRRDWRVWALRLAIIACIQFLILTLVAMLVYAGGTAADPKAPRYQFFGNFFSDLGRTVAHNGEPNTFSAALFFVALSGAGLALVLFFFALPATCRGRKVTRWLSILGSIAGTVSGLSFVGVALTPSDVAGAAHTTFVYYAFVSFLVAVVLYLIAVSLVPDYPRIFAAVFAAFGAILAAYVWLIFSGPDPGTARGLLIQVTGQKVVVYAAIVTALVEAYGARRVIAARGRAPMSLAGRLSS